MWCFEADKFNFPSRVVGAILAQLHILPLIVHLIRKMLSLCSSIGLNQDLRSFQSTNKSFFWLLYDLFLNVIIANFFSSSSRDLLT
uniref:Uncharacterized protein n=1 Tax=Rhizophora mucronata TaxID=61149 RepID=A0A2P2IJR5_RHIMU